MGITRKCSTRFSSNSEADASELLENLEFYCAVLKKDKMNEIRVCIVLVNKFICKINHVGFKSLVAISIVNISINSLSIFRIYEYQTCSDICFSEIK